VIVARVWFSSLDLDALLGLDRLVQAVGPAPARHLAAGELVDDDDLAVLDDVVDVALEQRVGLERLVDVVQDLDVLDVVEVVDAERFSTFSMPGSVSVACGFFSSTS
jgi:hypothetical protein